MVFRLPLLGVVTSKDFGALAFVVLFCCFIGGMVGYCCGCSDPSAPTENPLWGTKKDDGDASSAEEGAAKTKKPPPPPPTPPANVGERQHKANQRALDRQNSLSKKEMTKSEKFEASLERKRSAGGSSFNAPGGKKGSDAAARAKAHADKKKAAMEKADQIKRGIIDGDESAARKPRSPRFKDEGTHV